MKFDRTIVTFFVLFLVVYFLESIGGFYMTSAIVSIEKQFQIPSKVTGLMVSASDFGYIPSVVFVSYLGGKGNRARWIGGGCVLIAIANLMISASNFLFPVENISLNSSVLAKSIERDTRRLKPTSANFQHFLLQLTPEMRFKVQLKNFEETWLEKFEYCNQLEKQNIVDDACRAFHTFLNRNNAATKADIDNMRILSATSYAYCDEALNHLRSIIQNIQCKRGVSNFGPTATIFIGLLFLGVGRTMPFSLGLPLIDDNVKKKNLPVYFAGMFFIRIMGPVIGFMMGSFFNKFYYTSNVPQGITPRDPMWIGMWWGGFLVIGIVLFGPSMGLFCFRAPTYNDSEEILNQEIGTENVEKVASKNGNSEFIDVKNKDAEAKEQLLTSVNFQSANKILNENIGAKFEKKKKRRLALVDRHAELNENGDAFMPFSFKEKVNDFFGTISTVIKQPIYVGALTGRIIDVLAFKGFYIFLPKYLEIQFGIAQYKINMYMGAIGVVGFACGVLVGSVVLRVFKLEGRRVATWVAVCSGLAACLSFMNAKVGCRSTLTTLGNSISNNFNINSTCLSTCGCERAPLYPVCDQNGQVFYSPCHAGCKVDLSANKTMWDKLKAPQFSQCKCAANDTKVSRDFCLDDDCDWKVKLYFGNMAVSGIIGGMGVIPGILIMLRSVPPKHRSVSLGFNGFLVSLLATLPSPILWGTVIDYFCIYWEKKCDGRGACSLYATDSLRVWLHCIYGTLRMLALITDIYVIYHAKNLKITDTFGNKEIEKSLDENKLNEIEINKQDEIKSALPKGVKEKGKRNKDSASLPGEVFKNQSCKPLIKKNSASDHNRSTSREFNKSLSNVITSEDLIKSSTYIAGQMSD